MGMFDYVRCDAPLPDGKPTPASIFQTKDFDDPNMDIFVITDDGRLICDTPRQATEALEFHGVLNFYGGLPGEWREFNAKFTDGKLVEITIVGRGVAA